MVHSFGSDTYYFVENSSNLYFIIFEFFPDTLFVLAFYKHEALNNEAIYQDSSVYYAI